ncbi:hypothetical protein ACH5RR_016202, partial [Cinchona calisaya]
MRGLTNLLLLLFLFTFFCLEDCRANDSITITRPIRDSEIIVSSGQIYKLGFFNPVNTSDRYLGIIMNIPVLTVIWVANRDNPLKDSTGMLTISQDGNLVLLNGQKDILWSSNVSISVANASAQLLDTGNLVLKDNSNGRIVWESFQVPTDTQVQKMRLGVTVKNKNRLTAWRSPSDPSIGSFSFGFDPPGIPEVFVWNESKPYWRSGPWDSNVFIGIPDMASAYKKGFYMVDENTENAYLTYDSIDDSTLIYQVLSSSGVFVEKVWYIKTGELDVTWTSLRSECDVYGKCGPFGMCNPKGSPICTCLQGFKPRNKEEWGRGNWSGGCSRKSLLQCGRNNSAGQERKPDGFLKLKNVKVPDFYYSVEFSRASREEPCGNECSNNCSCIAYAYSRGIGCMHWSGNLIDIQQFPFDGADLYIRVAYSEL